MAKRPPEKVASARRGTKTPPSATAVAPAGSATPSATDGSGRPPTLETVAARAGVSRATASRVVNNLDRVAPHVVESVNAAIRELGYVPNQAARSLARRRTAVVAVVIPEPTERLFADPFFAAVVQGAAGYLSDTDYTLNLAIGSNESEKSRRYLTGGNVDGVLVISQHEGDLPLTQLGLAVPIVFAGRPAVDFGEHGHYVDVDNRGAAREAVRHLVERGRTRIATIAGSQDLAAGRQRLDGWRDALAEAGLRDDLFEVGTSLPAQARSRRSGCWRDRSSTRSSRPTTRWPSAPWPRWLGQGARCRTTWPSSASTTTTSVAPPVPPSPRCTSRPVRWAG